MPGGVALLPGVGSYQINPLGEGSCQLLELDMTEPLAGGSARPATANRSARNVARLHRPSAGDAAQPPAETDSAREILNHLRASDDAGMDEVHGWRDQFQADQVCLVVDSSSRLKGLASFPNGPVDGF